MSQIHPRPNGPFRVIQHPGQQDNTRNPEKYYSMNEIHATPAGSTVIPAHFSSQEWANSITLSTITLNNMLCWNNSVRNSQSQKNQQLELALKDLREELDRVKESSQKDIKPQICKPITLDMSHKNDSFLIRKFGIRTYKYTLAAVKSVPKQVYKQRNFNMVFKLVDGNKNPIINCNPIPIGICLYDPANPQVPITTNKFGRPIFKGHSESTIFKGRCEFRKLHIKQVTSSFSKGWVYAVIYPKQPSFDYSFKDSNTEVIVQFDEIKPIAISNVVVRAKKK